MAPEQLKAFNEQAELTVALLALITEQAILASEALARVSEEQAKFHGELQT